MCGIFGRITLDGSPGRLPRELVVGAQERGRDSWGVVTDLAALRVVGRLVPESVDLPYSWFALGNARAEPTTEWVSEKSERDVQPFEAGALVVAHNGTFANDLDLCRRYGIPERSVEYGGSEVDTARWAEVAARVVDQPEHLLALLGETVGSYGLAAVHTRNRWAVLVANYRPIWTRVVEEGGGRHLEFTSVSPRALPYLRRLDEGWEMLDPYSALVLEDVGSGAPPYQLPLPMPAVSPTSRFLVVCSGGLDSSVVASKLVHDGEDVDLLHITYGARAQAREGEAVRALAERLGTGLRFLDLTEVFSAIGHSRLTGTWQGAAAGEAGAEYAHEWVPARNTILLAAALGIAEGHGYTHLALGNNIEEAGAYPDNEQEFIGRFNDLLPFAVADGKRVRVVEPVGGLTKREIVALGLAVDAPLDLTWSCYDGGTLHCGDCGPCYMRRTAFSMAGRPDPIRYANG